MEKSEKELLELYRWMLVERAFDMKVDALLRMGRVMSMYHSVQGSEGAYVGSYFALKEGDVFTTRSRGNAAYLMRGWDIKRFMAGIYGKKEGIGSGRSPIGSHMTGDPEIGLIPTSGAIGSAITIGVGAALAFKLQKRPNVALIIFGDGGSNRGDVHEAMNFAAVFKLPVVFHCVNNGWAISVRSSYAVSVDQISKRAAGYNIPGLTIDGNDVLKVYDTFCEAIERARSGQGPSLIESKVTRWTAHSGNDPDIYRTPEERAKAREIDPITEYEKVLFDLKVLDAPKKEEMYDEVVTEIEEAVEYAESCNEPDLEDMLYGVYATPIKV